ncbi:MAG: lasso peptide biosynthesis B2 protein [Anaerolineales bacterium]|nr:lasso peptide biosynthesis B2 protein [Anaerolineales bacterium]
MKYIAELSKFRAKIWRLGTDILAFMLLPVISFALSNIGYKRVSWLLVKSSPSPIKRSDTQWEHQRARAIAKRINRIAEHGIIKASCLERSLLLWWLLRFQRISTELQIGVQINENGKLIGHAWLERDGVVVNDKPNVGDYYSKYPAHMIGPESIVKIWS